MTDKKQAKQFDTFFEHYFDIIRPENRKEDDV